MEIMQNLHADGLGENDHSAIARYYEKLTGTEIRSAFSGGAVCEEVSAGGADETGEDSKFCMEMKNSAGL